MSHTLTPDLCVIGAGAAGLSVASGAVQMGASVVLIEKAEMGGDCLNFGCVPSKALLAAAHRAQVIRTQSHLGVQSAAPAIDFDAVKAHIRSVIGEIAPHDSQERFEGLGVTVLREHARFVGPELVEAGTKRIKARKFVIATGSKPAVPPIPGLAGVSFLTNETIFDVPKRPEHLLILGGGPIGIELAQGFRRLGSKVTVVEALGALGRDDPEAVAIVLAALRDEGVVIEEGTRVDRVSGRANDITLHTTDGRAIGGSDLLVAVGRVPFHEGLGLDEAGIDVAKGRIVTDAGLRTSNRRVYAIGDAAGGMQFTHVAGYHAGLIIRSTLFRMPIKARTDHIPRVTYTEPELAQIGLTETEARLEHGVTLSTVRFAHSGNDRARAEAATTGFTKVMVARDRPVGVTIVGLHAGDMMGIWSLAIANTMKMSAIAGMVAPYPTLGEIPKQVAGAYFSPRLFENNFLKRVVRTLKTF